MGSYWGGGGGGKGREKVLVAGERGGEVRR